MGLLSLAVALFIFPWDEQWHKRIYADAKTFRYDQSVDSDIPFCRCRLAAYWEDDDVEAGNTHTLLIFPETSAYAFASSPVGKGGNGEDAEGTEDEPPPGLKTREERGRS
ncbi:hypothetical protein KEM54_006367 [Ascosphaera aggregata]|nr:hypothetical protein KEM54_006367 [Ascosphaera aggregata]